MPTIYDPTTQVITNTPSGPVVTRKSFADEYGNGNKIPTNLIDPVAAAIQGYFPKPNTTGTLVNGVDTNNFFYNVPSSNPVTAYFGRLDWDITHHNRLTVSETSSDNPATYLNQGICPVNCQNGDVSRDNAQVSDVWTISSNTINEARMGFTDQLNFFTPFSLNEGFPAKLGWQFAKADTFPNININQFYNLAPQSNAVYKEFVFRPIRCCHDGARQARHPLRWRVPDQPCGFHRVGQPERRNDDLQPGLHFGDWRQRTDSAARGNPAVSGFGYADFLLGQTQSWNAQVTPEFGGRIKLPQAFVQDDITLRPNLVINLGLRWQGMTGWSEVKGNEAVFDPTVVNPADNTLGAMWYGFSAANGRKRLQHGVWDYIPAAHWIFMAGTPDHGGPRRCWPVCLYMERRHLRCRNGKCLWQQRQLQRCDQRSMPGCPAECGRFNAGHDQSWLRRWPI